ncbi:MAG: type II toxin-antitoxin system RelB/DinJ family antitoxin [Alteromonadaceae bacterium]|nr:type II toxin-antitoxin system RelB/DinJ family antitoxin [Alteromonadaceae bacterium]
MPAQTSMLHVRVDDRLKAQATDALSDVGLSLSDAVRILLTRVAAEGGMPAGLTTYPSKGDLQ